MKPEDMLNPKRWAERTFGASQRRDVRRTRRAVQVAEHMAAKASASLPAQMQGWKEVIALDRLLDEEDVTFEALMQPHWNQTREHIQQHPLVLLVQDTTEIDVSHRAHLSGTGQVGNERGRGFHLQTMLAVLPQSRTGLGCAMQEPFVRTPAPTKERRDQRRFRQDRETDVWMRLVSRIGSFPASSTIVHVGDRGADMFDFFHACRTTQTHFLLRAAQNRRTQSDAQEVGYVLDQARAWPSQESHSFEVPASHGRQARTTQLHISFGAMTLLPPRHEPRANKQPFSLWVIRLWEEESPPGVEPLEWILLSSLPIHTLAQAWERANWYAHRWVVEDDHQCLKTGCRIEQRQRQTVERFFRLLGLLSPVAVRLLQLRDIARSSPDHPACEVVEADLLPVVAAQADLDPSVMTTEVFWREVARLGGYLPRRRDGPPGWKTLWAGWLRVQTLLEGFHLASHLLSCVV